LIKFGKSASETLAILTVTYGEYAMKKSSVFEWQRPLKKRRENVQDNPISGQPKTERTGANVERIRTNGESTVLFGSADKVMEIC
jgi:hypothetical protein